MKRGKNWAGRRRGGCCRSLGERGKAREVSGFGDMA